MQHFPEEGFLIELPVVIIKTSNLTLPVGSCETNLIENKKQKKGYRKHSEKYWILNQVCHKI